MSYIGNKNVEYWSTPGIEWFSGDGVTTTFTLTRKVFSENDLLITVNGAIQDPENSYELNYTNSTIVFSEAPLPGSKNIIVQYDSRQATIFVPSQWSVTPYTISVGGPSWDKTGNVFVSNYLTAEGIIANTITANTISCHIDANNITGTMNTATMGSGTANANMYLAGDNTWKRPVNTFSAGTTGFSPTTATNGVITLSGTLNTSNGGTGLTSFTTNGALYATNTSTLTTGILPVAAGGTGLATITANNVLLGNGTGTLQKVAPGTANNILVSNGSTWISGNAVTYGIGTSGLTAQKFTTNGTFTVPQNINRVKVTVVGGGGGYVISPDLRYGSKGGDGGVSVKYVTGLTPGQTIAITIGTIGTPLNAYVGTAGTGGNTSFGSYCTATGGAGGYYDTFSIAQDGASGLSVVGDFGITGYKYNQIGTSTYYGEGAEYNQTTPNGLVLVEY